MRNTERVDWPVRFLIWEFSFAGWQSMQTLHLRCRLFLCGESLLCSCVVSQSDLCVVERISGELCLDEPSIERLESSPQYPDTLSLWGSRPEDLWERRHTCFYCLHYMNYDYILFINIACVTLWYDECSSVHCSCYCAFF